MHVHGGGPAIVRDELDMYSKDAFAQRVSMGHVLSWEDTISTG